LVPNQPIDLILEQGIWDMCREQQSNHDRLCGQADELGYFEQVPVRVARGLMPTSLVLTLLGLVVAALGVRCWQKEPRHLWALPAPAGSTLVVGYSLVLSYLGSCLEILGGLALALSFHHCCKE
ncbi:Claudin-23, partial [Fulmarus glacialis]